jgi:hypothetical protein
MTAIGIKFKVTDDESKVHITGIVNYPTTQYSHLLKETGYLGTPQFCGRIEGKAQEPHTNSTYILITIMYKCKTYL